MRGKTIEFLTSNNLELLKEEFNNLKGDIEYGNTIPILQPKENGDLGISYCIIYFIRKPPRIAQDEERQTYGTYNNIRLTGKEYETLKNKTNNLGALIERMSYRQTQNKPYKNHYAALNNWIEKDRGQKQSINLEDLDLDTGF